MGEVIKLTEEQAQILACYDDNELGFEMVDESDGVDEGKYISWETIYQRQSDGKHFIQYNSKSGSYHSDYEFYFGDELFEVEKKGIVTTEWKLV